MTIGKRWRIIIHKLLVVSLMVGMILLIGLNEVDPNCGTDSGRILITEKNMTTQIPTHMVKERVTLSFSEWLNYFKQLKIN